MGAGRFQAASSKAKNTPLRRASVVTVPKTGDASPQDPLVRKASASRMGPISTPTLRPVMMIPNAEAATLPCPAARLGMANRQAGEAYRAAIAIEPDLGEAHWNLGQVLRDLEILEDAADACRRAVEINPDNAQAGKELGLLLLRLDRHWEGLEELKNAEGMIEFSTDPSASFRII